MRQGAWNLLVLGEDDEVLMTHLQRYGEYVILRRRVPAVEAKLAKVTRWLMIGGGVLFLIGGERVVELIKLVLPLVK
jgi:hypothetical protein